MNCNNPRYTAREFAELLELERRRRGTPQGFSFIDQARQMAADLVRLLRDGDRSDSKEIAGIKNRIAKRDKNEAEKKAASAIPVMTESD